MARLSAPVALAGVFAAMTLLAATAFLAALGASEGGWAARIPLSIADEQRAAHAVATARTPNQEARAEAASRKALAQSPASASSWVRLAYIEARRGGGLTPGARASLARSYEVSPLGPDVSLARLRIVFEHWAQAPSDLRAQALAELALARCRNYVAVDELGGQISDPAGRLAMRMATLQIAAEQAPRGYGVKACAQASGERR